MSMVETLVVICGGSPGDERLRPLSSNRQEENPERTSSKACFSRAKRCVTATTCTAISFVCPVADAVRRRSRKRKIFSAAGELTELGALKRQSPVVLGCDRDHEGLPTRTNQIIGARQIPLADMTAGHEPHRALVKGRLGNLFQFDHVGLHWFFPYSPPRQINSNPCMQRGL